MLEAGHRPLHVIIILEAASLGQEAVSCVIVTSPVSHQLRGHTRVNRRHCIAKKRLLRFIFCSLLIIRPVEVKTKLFLRIVKECRIQSLVV